MTLAFTSWVLHPMRHVSPCVFWETAPAIVLARRIKQHFDDIAAVHRAHEPEKLSLPAILASTARKIECDPKKIPNILRYRGECYDVQPRLGGEVMRAILEGLPYPATLLNAAVQRCRAEQQVTYPRAAIIKACLNRWIRFRHSHDKEYLPMLDFTNTNPGYRLGRLFATLEKSRKKPAPASMPPFATVTMVLPPARR